MKESKRVFREGDIVSNGTPICYLLEEQTEIKTLTNNGVDELVGLSCARIKEMEMSLHKKVNESRDFDNKECKRLVHCFIDEVFGDL